MRRPWNIPDVPVYSLVTSGAEGVNMNICTYVSAVSMKPKQYLVAVYKNTRTLENLEKGSSAVLQLLDRTHASLVNPLGKKSGKNYQKQRYLEKRKVLTDWKGFRVLKDAVAWVELKPLSCFDTGGDHLLYCFEAVGYKTNKEHSVLTMGQLIKKGIIL